MRFQRLAALVVINTPGSSSQDVRGTPLQARILNSPQITTQPVNQTVTVGQTASFSVTATGTAALSYQWNKNGAAIGGATSANYTTPATTSADNGAQFSAVISNPRTLGIRLGWSHDGVSQKEWTIKDESTLLKTLKAVRELLERTGFPFLERYSRTEEAMSVLEADNQEARRIAGPDDKRAKEAIAMALLTRSLPAAIAMRDKKLASWRPSSSKDAYDQVSKWASSSLPQRAHGKNLLDSLEPGF